MKTFLKSFLVALSVAFLIIACEKEGESTEKTSEVVSSWELIDSSMSILVSGSYQAENGEVYLTTNNGILKLKAGGSIEEYKTVNEVDVNYIPGFYKNKIVYANQDGQVVLEHIDNPERKRIMKDLSDFDSYVQSGYSIGVSRPYESDFMVNSYSGIVIPIYRGFAQVPVEFYYVELNTVGVDDTSNIKISDFVDVEIAASDEVGGDVMKLVASEYFIFTLMGDNELYTIGGLEARKQLDISLIQDVFNYDDRLAVAASSGSSRIYVTNDKFNGWSNSFPIKFLNDKDTCSYRFQAVDETYVTSVGSCSGERANLHEMSPLGVTAEAIDTTGLLLLPGIDLIAVYKIESETYAVCSQGIYRISSVAIFDEE